MTITNPDIVRNILKSGCQDDGIKFVTIYAYKSIASQAYQFALFTDARYDDMDRSPYVNRSSVVLLAENGILTPDGQRFISGAF